MMMQTLATKLSPIKAHFTATKVDKETLKRASINLDSVICISGYPGVGKTTLGITLGLLSKVIDAGIRVRVEPFDYSKNIVWNRQDFLNFVGSSRRQVIVADEAISLLYKRESQSSAQIGIIKLLNKCRKLRHTLIFMIPNFNDIDIAVRSSRVLYWIHVISRGEALVFERDDQNFTTTDPWYLKDLGKLLIRGKISDLEQIPTFKGKLLFNDLPSDHKKTYRAIADIHASIGEESSPEIKALTAQITQKFEEGKEEGIVYALRWLKDCNFLKVGALSTFKRSIEFKFGSFDKVMTYMKEKAKNDVNSALAFKKGQEIEKIHSSKVLSSRIMFSPDEKVNLDELRQV